MTLTLPSFSNITVLVVGDVMLDRYWHGCTNHISPEAPVPIVKVNTVEERPGGAANVAVNIAALGANSRLIGLIGDDNEGSTLTKILRKNQVECDFIVVKNYPTITKLRVLSCNQQLIRIDFEKIFEKVATQLVHNRIRQYLVDSNVLICSDYAKGTLNYIQSIIQLAHEFKVPILIDPKNIDFERYRGATIITPNLTEFEAVVGKCKTENEIVDRGMKLISHYDFSALLITRSERGMTLLQPYKTPLHLHTQAKEVFDVTGAGDTVISVLATILATGLSIERSCFFANIAAGIVVGKLGGSIINKSELENNIHMYTNINFGILNQIELKNMIELARQRGEKIVMTNGVFDILHIGHISYLEEAKKLGDRLIVAVNSDDSTKRLKGKKRPINTLNNRMRVLSALKSIDWIVSFEEDTPQRLIMELLPDVLVKGGDYEPEDIVGSKEIWDNGGDVRVLNFKTHISTSNIIENIRNQ
ncbi:bifunctional D-glycero-beta-D-manno-heptose-7-phosphate kinase/D-glycero-beta-D-manno-heptose 1-phosphate adenylyltransferase HldE [Pantoea sp. Mhis]|uniref:bifunctional D-glycero-beta-D-manno-heptose-7-phosphate kinase/D-glycero-beta-D-manno-heptose 1-phosphate adenylyltransferase HldE n=1 Tax=Pantoea sp. Mhis TaxID=2576759 RepID=UPI00135C467A|nr:bifunctional D-glycero-beta-D-manno-heptose-7-phosphate kinase/D-glycero-beta-D-manno-heptose 1-phosphate adenylyltransferase HldE [Pantoea sp. Mhis]MXP56405.1 bifunctional D-glycero-beta-D-manno-heptose-7-phosphate kinase/D-glycero-beta-D-manno-heptose 1-phosphate adenylyltransferase HldE [Pantoea sp. Mhis]